MITPGLCPPENLCPDCGHRTGIGLWPWCPHGEVVKKDPFTPYEVTHEGKTHRISNILDANKVERETMQNFKNGEGTPIVLRAFHQSNSNRDVNTLKDLGYTQKEIHSQTKKGVPFGVERGRRSPQ